MITLKIPFQGFYESAHSMLLDDAENYLFTDSDSENQNEGLINRFQCACNYNQVFTEYAKGYTKAFKDDFNIPSLKFINLHSPREYNFSTDKIECSISRADVRRIYKEADKSKLTYFVAQHCTSRSGFCSFYSPDLKDWGYVDNWEHAQLSLLVQFYFENHYNYDNDWEYDTMQRWECNGYVTQLLEQSCPIIDRVYKIHDYLQCRESRGGIL